MQSSHNASGYFTILGDEAEFADHFNARLVTGSTGEVYARTGYLGFLRRTEPGQQLQGPGVGPVGPGSASSTGTLDAFGGLGSGCSGTLSSVGTTGTTGTTGSSASASGIAPGTGTGTGGEDDATSIATLASLQSQTPSQQLSDAPGALFIFEFISQCVCGVRAEREASARLVDSGSIDLSDVNLIST